MVTLLILLILFIGAYSGYKNGLVVELLKAIGYAFTLILAFDHYRALSDFLYLIVPYPSPYAPAENPYHYYDISLMFSLDDSYYHMISFFAIVVVGWLLTRFIVQFISYYLEELKAPEPVNGIAGAVMGYLVNYVGIFMVLFILTTIPFDFVQSRLSGSFLANNILTSSPVLSDRAYQHFVLDVHDEKLANQPLMDIEMPAEEEGEGGAENTETDAEENNE